MTLREALQNIHACHGYGGLPCYDEIERSVLVRVLSPDDIFNFFTENFMGNDSVIHSAVLDLPIGTESFITGSTQMTLAEALQLIVESRISHLPILDEDGILVGALLEDDLAKILERHMHSNMEISVLTALQILN
jgi:CBS-domain-containing membrane protein